MSPLSINALDPLAAKSLQQASPEVRSQPAGATAVRGIATPAEIVSSAVRVSESTVLAVIRDAVEGGRLTVALAGTSVAKIGAVLIDVLKLVTTGPAETGHPVDVQQRAGTLLATIDDAVSEATVRGVNLIAGSMGGAVTATKLTIVGGLDGSVVTIGGTGVAAMNASAAGLGLANFVASGRGVTMTFPAAIAAGGTTITLQTSNHGGSSNETPQFPGRQWTFEFTPAGLPTQPSEAPPLDSTGDLLRLDTIVTVPLAANFTTGDAVAALGMAMTDRGFEIGIERNGAGATVLRIAGNNIDVSTASTESLDRVELNSPRIVAAPPQDPGEDRDVPPALGPSGHLPAIIVSPWEGADAAMATLASAMRKAEAMGQTIGGQIIILNELQNSLPDETSMMIASESLYLGSALANSEAILATAEAQRRLDGEAEDLSDHMSRLLLRFFQWRHDHTGHEPTEDPSNENQTAEDEAQPPDEQNAKDVADEPFLEAWERGDEPA